MITKLDVRTQCNLPAVYTDGLTTYQAIGILTAAVNNCIAKIGELTTIVNNLTTEVGAVDQRFDNVNTRIDTVLNNLATTNANLANVEAKADKALAIPDTYTYWADPDWIANQTAEQLKTLYNTGTRLVIEPDANTGDERLYYITATGTYNIVMGQTIANVGTLQNQVNNANTNITTNRTNITNLTTELDTANTTITQHTSQISYVNSLVRNNTDRIINIETDLTNLSEYIILYPDPGWIQTQTTAQLKQLYDEKTRFISQGDGTSDISYLYGLTAPGGYVLIAQSNA